MIDKTTTKEYLEQSAIELFSQNPIDKVTVTDIVKNCGLTTRTFYNYFKDKYDIMNTCYISTLEDYYYHHKDTLSFHNFLSYTAELIYQNRLFFINVFQYTGQNNMRKSVVEPLRNLYLRLISEVYHDEITPDLYDSITFFISGTLAYVEDALTMAEIPLPEKSVAYFENALPANLLKYIR